VKLATGLVATISALVLGLLISSAKGSFDRINNDLVEDASRIVSMDRLLARYGPEASELRGQLKRGYAARVEALVSGDAAQLAKLAAPESVNAMESIDTALSRLAPRNDMQRELRLRAQQISGQLASTQVLGFLQSESSLPTRLLGFLVLWLVVVFAGFGLCAPRNYTTIGALFACSLSASGAILLILELEQPLHGTIGISAAPLRAAVMHLGL
jgi:hypothetical protein